MVRELGIGGCERDLTKLARRLDRSRFQPHVGCFRDNGFRAEELRNAGVPIVRFPVTSFRSPSLVRAIAVFRNYIQEHKIRLVHTLDVPTNIFGIASARISGLRPAIASQLWFLNTIPRQLWTLHRLSMRFADAVVVNSDAVRSQLAAENKKLADRVFVSHNGVETDIFYPAPRTGNSAAETIVIGSVCALRPEKRLDLLIEAFAQVRKKFTATKLLIVGSGEMRAALERRSEELGIRGHCEFQPAQLNVVPWMHAIDVFVVSSESESFPNALLEAMACGCCVIGSNVGGIPELIESGESGLLFEPGSASELSDRLFTVLNDASLRKRLASQAAQRARDQFSIERAIARMEQIYNSLL